MFLFTFLSDFSAINLALSNLFVYICAEFILLEKLDEI